MKGNDLKGSQVTDEKDPCARERRMSMKCLSDNDYDYSKCGDFFENFKSCKDFWVKVQAERRKRLIYPYLPPSEERDAIKKKFMETGKIPATPDD